MKIGQNVQVVLQHTGAVVVEQLSNAASKVKEVAIIAFNAMRQLIGRAIIKVAFIIDPPKNQFTVFVLAFLFGVTCPVAKK